jgi:hypothetical protein
MLAMTAVGNDQIPVIGGLKMRNQWISNEHYRLHTVEAWPDGPYKDATLRAIHSTLDWLMQDPSSGAGLPTCEICLNQRRAPGVLEFPGNQVVERAA